MLLLCIPYCLANFVTYFFVKLHDNHQFVIWLWRPFHKCLFHFRKRWNIHSSLVTTFIILSYIKILNVSFQLVIPSFTYNMEEQKVNKLYLYYAGTIEMISKEYLPYLLFTIFMLIATFQCPSICFACVIPLSMFSKGSRLLLF